jgi:hypothetical protein
MVMWMFEGIRRIKVSELLGIQKQRSCVLCQGYLLRLAERGADPPYPWIPNGYICSKCNTMYMGVP